MCIAITHGVTVNGPSLSTRPGTLIVIPLGCLPTEHFARNGFIVYHMIAASIGTKVMGQCGIGMAHRYLMERGISREACGLKE